MQPSVSVIVITHNRRRAVADCLRSLLASTYPLHQLIVVDNASTDDTREYLAREFPDVTVIAAPSNLLPSAAVNLGAARASGTYLLAMADDNVVDKAMIAELVVAAETTGAGIVGAKNFFKQEPERIWSFGCRFNLTTGICRNPHAGEMDRGQCTELWEPDAVQNALLMTRSLFDDLGGFDATDFPIHNEEADFCYRAKRTGARIVSAPRARIWHDVSPRGEWLKVGTRDFTVDSPMRAYYTARNRVLLVRKYGKRWQWRIFATLFHPLASAVYAGAILGKQNRWSLMKAYLRGTAAAYGRLP